MSQEDRSETKMRNVLFTLALVGLLVAPASAATIFTENFDATSGNENGEIWGTSDVSNVWTAGYTGTENPMTSSGNLTYSGLADSSGSGKVDVNSPTTSDRGRTATGGWTSVESGGYYLSYLLRVTSFSGILSSWDDGCVLTSWRDTDNSNVVGLRQVDANNGVIMISERSTDLANGPSDAQSSGEIALTINTTYLIVLGVDDVTDSAAGSFELWVNPTQLGGAAPTADTSGEWRTSGGANNDGFSIGTESNWTGVYIDEVRIGTTYADVTPVPEPATLGLLGLGGLGLLLKRRRRIA